MAIRQNWLPLMVSIEIILVALYALTVLLNGGKPYPLFDVNGTRTIPSYLQALQLFFIGALPLWLCITYRCPQVPPSRILLAFVGLLFCYISMDELFKFNFSSGQHKLWQLIYLAVGLAIPIVFFRDLVRLYRLSPQSMRVIAIGIGVFIVGGFGLELFRSHVQEPHWYRLFGRWQFYQVDAIRTALEEFGEMLGETIVIKGMVQLAQKRQIQVALR
ncbi:MAG: hypothetical protein ACFB0D_07140 [Phormidesmis sp.]